MKRYDVVVLGAGPSGSSAAYFLADAGLKVAVVEKNAFPRRKVCGEYVTATTLALLKSMGLEDAVVAASGPEVKRIAVFGEADEISASMPAANDGDGWGCALSRSILDPTLLNAAAKAGAVVYQPWKAVDLKRTSEGHVCRIESGEVCEELVSDAVIAAHGSWEIGMLPTQLEKTHEPDDLFAFKAFYRGAVFDEDLMALIAFPGGYGGIVHNDIETVGLSCCIRRDTLQQCRDRYQLPTAGDSVLAHLRDSVEGISRAFEKAELVEPPLAAGPLHPGIRTRYADGIFRVGNAAGEAHPVIAEGISMAIQSGFLVGENLRFGIGDQGDLDDAGEAYSKAWLSQFGGRITAANIYSKLCMSETARKILTPVLRAFPALLTAGAVFSGKTKSLSISS